MADDVRNAKMLLGVETKGTDKAAANLQKLGKGATDLQKELGRISRTSQIDDLAKEMGEFARETGETGKAVDELNKKLKALGANEDEIKSAARGFESARTGGASGGGGGSAPAAAKFRGAASLIGGGEIVGLIDDFQDLGEGIVQLKDSAPGAAQSLFSLAASMGPGGLLVAGAAAVVVAGLGLAVKGLADESQKAFDTVSSILDEQRSIREQVAAGATQQDLTKQLEETIRLRDLEAAALDRNKQAYEDQFKPGGFVDGFSTLFNGAEDALAQDLDKGTKLLSDYDIKIRELQGAIDSGIAPIGETTAAEQELAQVRQTETSKSIDTAANAERERARAAEQQAREQERIAAEQQRRAEQVAAAQQKYADGIKNANTALKQATQDINTKLKQGLADNLESMFRDVTDIATQYRRDTFDMDLKANQAERDALTEHYRDIEDIRDDALKSEREAIQDGDFKQLFLARQAGADALKQEQKETLREKADRTRALGDERADLLRNAERTRADRMLALERQNADTRTAAQRELQQAQLTRTRALEMNAASYKSELAALGSFLQQRNQLLNAANQQALQGLTAGGRGGNQRLTQAGQSIQNQMAAAVGGIIRR